MEAYGRESDRRKTPRGSAASGQIVHAGTDLTRPAASLEPEDNLRYASCFAAALTSARKAALVTGGKDFERVGSLIKASWI
jgi:hypothetical protein